MYNYPSVCAVVVISFFVCVCVDADENSDRFSLFSFQSTTFQILNMTTTTDTELTSPSNALDEMISMSIMDHEDSDSNTSISDQTNPTRRSWSPRYDLFLTEMLFSFFFASRFRSIESLKRLSWNNTGPEQLIRAEMKIFETLKTAFQGRHISIANNTQKIWTVYSNLTSKNYPIVLLHGFGGGVGLWSLNLDQLSVDRPVYALDLPGFARSSRPAFSTVPGEAEQQFVDLIEDWRKEIGLNEPFILLGHSFGGFISAAYAIRYPTYIKQLVLVDPWGFGRKPEDWQTSRMQRIPPRLRSFSTMLMKMSPLTGLRIAGPFGIIFKCYLFVNSSFSFSSIGVRIMKYFRPDLRAKYETLFDDDRILVYLYHCNAQMPTGEQGFRVISDFLAWAKGFHFFSLIFCHLLIIYRAHGRTISSH